MIAGISGSEKEGADSIVLSGGYEDDEDLGDEIVYTGHGGRDSESGKQVAHQHLTRGNLALAHSSINGLPVRVIRGVNLDSPYAPRSGYRYDGLYIVDDYWQELGKSSFRIWRYRLSSCRVYPLEQILFRRLLRHTPPPNAERRQCYGSSETPLKRDSLKLSTTTDASYAEYAWKVLPGLTQRPRMFVRLERPTTGQILKTTSSVYAQTTTCCSTTAE